MIEPGIVALALADQPTATLIADRMYPLDLPESPIYPAATYRLVSTVDAYTLDGPLGLVQVRLQVDAWGETYGQAKSVAIAFKNLLNNYTGALPNGVAVENVWRDGEMAGFDSTQRAYYFQTDWMIQYSEQ